MSEQQQVLVIGRAASGADVDLSDDDYVSGRHAELTRMSNGLVVVRDLGSTNGVWVNGVRVWGPRVLRPGVQLFWKVLVPADVLRIGHTEVAWKDVW